MDSNFTKDTTALMNEARLCAIDLGTGYISTIHLLLADCKINNQHSVRNFFFKTPLAFQTFYESQRVAETSFFDSVVVESLPVTVEMEQAIRIAQKQYNGAIKPYHLFLAASQLKETLFYSILEPKERLYERLENYYLQMGIVLRNSEAKKNLWQRLTSKRKLE